MPDMNGRENYPELDALIGGWFHQDCDLIADTFSGILQDYIQSGWPNHQKQAVEEIRRFIQIHGASERSLSEAFEAVFKPDTVVECWDGRTTRQ